MFTAKTHSSIRLRRVFSLLMTVLIVTGSFNFAFANDNKKNKESSNSLSPKKVVAILYDDSGSMRVDQHKNYKDKWFYANYAFQIFTGLFNSDDEILLTFMSKPNQVIKSNGSGLLKDFSADRQKTVDAIRKYRGSGDTPYDQIKFVGDQLSAVKDDDPATQYWYVIIADGRFEKKAGDSKSEVGQSEIDKALAPYAGKTMPNGSECNVLFMAIEDKDTDKKAEKGKDPAFPSESEYVQVERCNGEGIVDVMSRMADRITGRFRVDPSGFSVEGKTLTVTSPVPLLNIQVLAQNTKAKVSSAKVTDGDNLVCSSISMSTPKGDNEKFKKEGKKLYGTLGTITTESDYIPAGEYSITFDSDVSSGKIDVMYEAALETGISIYRKGKIIEDTSVLRENEKVDIKAELKIIGTDETIDITKLPKGLLESMTMTIDENGAQAVSESLGEGSSAIEIKDYVIKEGETLITARTELKGFPPLIARERFTAGPPVVYGITADGNELSVRRGYIRGKESVDFTVTGDGEPLSKAEVEALINEDSIAVTCGGKKTGVGFTYKISSDGKLHVYPKASLLDNAFAFPRVPKGEYDVTVSLDENTSATGHFTVKGYPLVAIIISLIILALILLMLYLIFKTHFPNARIQVDSYSFKKSTASPLGIKILTSSPEKPVRLSRFTDFFRIFGPRRVREHGLELVARPGSKVYLSHNWVNNNKGKFLIRSVVTESKTAKDTAAINAFKKLTAKAKQVQDVLTEEPLGEGDVLYVLSGKNVISYEIHKKGRR